MNPLKRLQTLPDPQIQRWLMKVERVGVELLVLSLVGSEAELSEAIYRNMSPRAKQSLRREVELRTKSAPTLKQIAAAQGELAVLL